MTYPDEWGPLGPLDLVDRDLPALERITTDPEENMGDRIRAVWAVVDAFLEEAVQAAEVMYGPGTGEEKKAWVTDRAMELLENMEAEHDVLPDFIESVVFRALEIALDWMIERVVGRLKEAGVV